MSHWYAQDGSPQHFVEGKNGSRDATLRDARKHGWVPGFSGVTQVLAKPGLDRWKEGQILDAAYSVQAKDDFDQWKAEVKGIASERSTAARDRGHEIHNAIEEYIKVGNHQDFPHEFEKYVSAVQTAIWTELELDLKTLEAETTFACGLGYGGMIDALSRSNPVLLDWKTKDTEFDDKTKLAYDDHGMQLAAYRFGVGMENAVCANVFISPSANVRIHIWDEDELERLWSKFEVCLKLWQIDRKYDSSFSKA